MKYLIIFLVCFLLSSSGYHAAYSDSAEQDTRYKAREVIVEGELRGLQDSDNIRYGDEPSDFLANWMYIKHSIKHSEALTADLQQRQKDVDTNEFIFGPPTFTCDTANTKSPQVPTSVHALRPGDINMVAAMGDSVTAGFGVGADNLAEVGNQNRGESWSVGGDQTLDQGVITLSNVLMKFNPELMGYSSCIGGSTNRHAWMNAAVGGATNVQMPGQARDVVNRAQNDPLVDFDNHWKVVTLFVGGNDLCRACTEDRYNSTNYRARIEEALDIYHAEMPRTLVNLVPMFDITPLSNFSEGIVCAFIQPFVCPCGIQDRYKNTSRSIQWSFYEELKDLVDSGKYDTRDDFTVVLQPSLVNLKPPIDPDTGFYDKSFLSHDCFHPSLKAHRIFAYMLWNTMLIKYQDKPLEWDLYEENPSFYCPTQEQPYIYTRLNSD